MLKERPLYFILRPYFGIGLAVGAIVVSHCLETLMSLLGLRVGVIKLDYCNIYLSRQVFVSSISITNVNPVVFKVRPISIMIVLK